MAEYIDLEAAIKCVENQCIDGKMRGCDDSDITLIDAYDVIDALSDLPADDVAPVVHGRWVPIMSPFRADWDNEADCWEDCSNCGFRMILGVQSPYCPECGARMDGDSDTADEDTILDLVDGVDTADAVQVVRCKNCKFYSAGDLHNLVGDECASWPYCDVLQTNMPPRGFCNYGTPKEEHHAEPEE